MSDTPRTDDALQGVWYRGDHGSAIPALCRALERELAEANRKLAIAISALEEYEYAETLRNPTEGTKYWRKVDPEEFERVDIGRTARKALKEITETKPPTP